MVAAFHRENVRQLGIRVGRLQALDFGDGAADGGLDWIPDSFAFLHVADDLSGFDELVQCDIGMQPELCGFISNGVGDLKQSLVLHRPSVINKFFLCCHILPVFIISTSPILLTVSSIH